MIQIHQIKPISKRKKGKRIGRGGKRGTYSGRGIKGQKARAGRKLKPLIRDWIKRYPKLRGWKFKGKRKKLVAINLREIERNFKEREIVSPETLLEKKLIDKIEGKVPEVKVLAKGKLTKKLIFSNLKFSKGAKEKIEKAKGEIK